MKKHSAVNYLMTLIPYVAVGACVCWPFSLYACYGSGGIAAVFDSCADCSVIWTSTTVQIPDPTLEGEYEEVTVNIPSTVCATKLGLGYYLPAGTFCDNTAPTGSQTCGVTAVSDGYYFTCQETYSLKAIGGCLLNTGITIATIYLTDSAAFWTQVLYDGGQAALAGLQCSPCDLFPCEQVQGDPDFQIFVDPTQTHGTCPLPS